MANSDDLPDAERLRPASFVPEPVQLSAKKWLAEADELGISADQRRCIAHLVTKADMRPVYAWLAKLDEADEKARIAAGIEKDDTHRKATKAEMWITAAWNAFTDWHRYIPEVQRASDALVAIAERADELAKMLDDLLPVGGIEAELLSLDALLNSLAADACDSFMLLNQRPANLLRNLAQAARESAPRSTSKRLDRAAGRQDNALASWVRAMESSLTARCFDLPRGYDARLAAADSERPFKAPHGYKVQLAQTARVVFPGRADAISDDSIRKTLKNG